MLLYFDVFLTGLFLDPKEGQKFALEIKLS